MALKGRSKIFTHFWYAQEAEEAARFYASIFPDSRVDRVTPLLSDTPSGPAGSVNVVDFTLFGQRESRVGRRPRAEVATRRDPSRCARQQREGLQRAPRARGNAASPRAQFLRVSPAHRGPPPGPERRRRNLAREPAPRRAPRGSTGSQRHALAVMPWRRTQAGSRPRWIASGVWQ